MTRARNNTFVWRDVARTDAPRTVPLARHGTQKRYSVHGCRCDECKSAHRRDLAEYRRRLREKDLVALGASNLIPRVKVSDADRTTLSCSQIVHWRLQKFARRHGVTLTQAMDIAIGRALDTLEPRYVYLQGAA